jgi:predicted kinase
VTDGPAPAGVRLIRIPAGLVVLVGPPASGKTSFARALIARRQIDTETVVSSDDIRAELAIAESTNVTRQARARLLTIARRFNTPVTMLRFTSDVTDLLQQHSERQRPDATASDVRAYAAIMMRDASADQLRAEGAAAVHDVPGRRQGVTPAEAADRFFFCCHSE